MGIGAAAVLATEPKLNRQIKAVLKQEDAAEKRHTARMKAEDAKLQVAQSAANLQLNTLQMTAEYAHAAYRAPEVQQAIQAAADDQNRDIGIHLYLPSVAMHLGRVSRAVRPPSWHRDHERTGGDLIASAYARRSVDIGPYLGN